MNFKKIRGLNVVELDYDEEAYLRFCKMFNCEYTGPDKELRRKVEEVTNNNNMGDAVNGY